MKTVLADDTEGNLTADDPYTIAPSVEELLHSRLKEPRLSDEAESVLLDGLAAMATMAYELKRRKGFKRNDEARVRAHLLKMLLLLPRSLRARWLMATPFHRLTMQAAEMMTDEQLLAYEAEERR